MRITLTLDHDALQALRVYAAERSLRLGEAASEFIRKALNTPRGMRFENGFWVVDLPASEEKVPSARVKQLLEEDF